MSETLKAQVQAALKTVKYPGMGRDILSFGFVRNVTVDGGAVGVDLEIATQNREAVAQLREDIQRAVGALPEVQAVEVRVTARPEQAPQARAQQATMQNPALIPHVKSVVAVASGKGGVGKSTVAANLAVCLNRLGHSVGLLDADIYGPSVPTMFGITERPRLVGNRLQPFEKYGLRLMSLGFVVDPDTPVIWRGPMVMKALEQLLGDVDWGELDYLVLDLPPGTGDVQLTLSQRLPMAGAVVVTTPQDVALIDARKGLQMFRKVNVPVLGIVENMSVFVCPHCGEATEIFKVGGGERTAAELGTRFLGRIPLDAAIVEGGDSGVPIAVAQADGPHAQAFLEVARAVADEVARGQAARPKLSIV